MDGNIANLNNAFDPLAAVRAFRKRWRLAAAMFITISAMSLLAALQIKSKFESEASLFVRLGRESAGLDPTATTSEITPIYETREQELNSTLEVIQSRKLLEAAIGVIGEDAVLDPTLFSFEKWQTALQNTSWPELDPEVIHRSNKAKEKAVEALYKAVTFEISRSSNIIEVTSLAPTPEMAQAITKTLLDAFRAEHVRLNQTHGYEFFQQQVSMLEGQLDDSRRAVADKKKSLGVMSIEGERARLEDVLTALEKQLHIEQAGLLGAQASSEIMAKEVKSLPDRTQPHDATDTLHKTLHELERKRETLLTRFTPRHFRVSDLDDEITLVKKQLADPRNRNAANPTLRELEVALATGHAKEAQTEASIQRLETTRVGLLAKLQELNDSEADMLKLKDRVMQLQAATVKASEKLEQARVLHQLSSERISNIQVVQPATFNPISMSPSRTLVVLAGVFVGLIAAFVVPAVVEFAAWYLSVLRTPITDSPTGPSAGEPVPCNG